MRWLGRTALILLAIVAVLAPALWIGRDVVPPRVARWAINHAAGAEVIDDLAFSIERLSTTHVDLFDLRVNRDTALTAERIHISFAPRELLAGRLRTATVTGAAVGAAVGPDGEARLGSLDAVIAAFSGGPSTPPTRPDPIPPLRRLVLNDAELRLSGAASGRLRLDGTIAPSASGAAASIAWRLDAAADTGDSGAGGLAVVAEGGATLDHDAGRSRINLTIADGRVARGTLAVDGLRGMASVWLPAGEPPAVSAKLSATHAVAGAVTLPDPSLQLTYDGSGLSGAASLGNGPAPEVTVAAVADAVTVNGRRPFRVEARADLARLDALLAAWAGRPPLELRGDLQADIAGSAALDNPDPAAVWADMVASGGLSVTVDDAAAGPAGRARGSGRLALALAAGRLAVETAEPLVLETTPAEPSLADPPVADPLLRGSLTATLGSVEIPFRALLEAPFGDGRAELTGPATLAAADGGRAAVDGTVSFRRGPSGWTLDRVARASVDATGVNRAGFELDRLQATIEDLTVGPAGPDGRFEVSLRGNVPERGVTGAAVSAAGRVESGDDGVHVLLSTPGRLVVDRLAPATPLAPIERLSARIATADRPVLTVPADGGPATLRLPLDLPAVVLASAEPDAWRIELQPLRVLAEATLDPAGAGRLRARLSGAAAALAPAGVTLEGLAADLRMDLAAGGARLRRVDVRAHRVADAARLARFAPLSLEGFARGAETAANPDRLAFRMTLRGADGAFVLDAEGHHAPATGRGEAALTLFPIRFVPGGLQPADLSPAAAAMFRGASGEISLGGRVRWPGEAVPPDDPLTMTVKGLGFSGSLGTVTGLDGAVAVTQVDPPATAPGQELTATAVDVGIPVVAPRVRFRLEPERILRLESVEARFAGGRVSAEDVAVPVDGKQAVPVVLAVDGVDAARLAEVIDLEGLSATGTLSGWLPLLWDPRTGLAIRQARLTAGTGGGSLRYDPKDGASALQDSGEQVSLLLKAIKNFEYESFEVEADGRPGEPFDIKLRLRGANPDLYDGYPIALNVTVAGALDQLFGNLRRSLGLTDVIRRRLEASGGG